MVSVAVVVVFDVLVWAGAVINTVVEALVVDVEVIVVATVLIVLNFVVRVSYSVDVLSGVVVDVLVDKLAGLSGGATICVVLGIGVEVLAGVNANIFAVAKISLNVSMTGPLAEFSC